MSSVSRSSARRRQSREPLLTTGRVDLVISTFTYTADRDTRIDFSRAYYKATGRLLVKNDSPIQSLNDIRGRKIATTPGSIYDRWMRRCFSTAEVLAVESVTAAVLAFNQGRADAVMFDDTSLALQAATDPNAKLTDDLFLEAPYGIGIRQGNVALKRWVDSRLNLMKQKDIFQPIIKNNVAPRFVPAFSKNILRPNNTFTYRAGDAAERRHRLSVGIARTIAWGVAAAGGRFPSRPDAARRHLRPLGVRLRELGGAARRPLNTLKVSAIAIVGAFVIGAVLGAARAHRIPVVSQLTAVYVEIDPEHADPRPDLPDLLRAAAVRDHAEPVHRGVALGDDLGRRVQQRELPRRLRGGAVPLPRGRLRARLRAARRPSST